MKRICPHFLLIFFFIALVSCNAKDDPNALIDTQFAPEVIDSCHILSPKTYSYLHNTKPPLGVKPVILVFDKLEESQIGTFADNIFDQFCEKKYSGNTFRKRGILIVASKSPELVQVRVGKTYDVYCRMKGSAAGADYLEMQKRAAERGIEEMVPVALKNVIKDIEECRALPWYKKIALKVSFLHVDVLMEDVATPSDSFFSQFYFRPFLYLVGGVKSFFGNWTLAFLFIAIVYMLIKNWIEDKINAYIRKRIDKESKNEDDKELNEKAYLGLKFIVTFLIKLVVTIPTFAAISILSSARMEDVIALQNAHIPSVELVENVTGWTNNTPGLWLVLLMVIVYYLKFLFCGMKGDFTLAHVSDRVQQDCYQNSPKYRKSLDTRIDTGYNRRFIQGAISMVGHFLPQIGFQHNFHEVDTTTVQDNINDYDEDGKPKKQPFDFFFLDVNDSLYKSSPALALQVNTHREALYLAFLVGIIAITLLSYTYVVYFLILWSVQLLFRVISEYRYAYKYYANIIKEYNPLRLFREVWITDVIFFSIMALLLAVLLPSHTSKTTDAVEEVQKALPEDLSGLYFVSKADGENTKGVTARLVKDQFDNYIMQVYSDKPMRRIPLTLDKNAGLFHSNILGDGYITYDEQTKSITINFSELWILTN